MSRLPASIGAVLPAYNESAMIADVVRRTHAALDASGVARHEAVVVDDGSNDGTAGLRADRDANGSGNERTQGALCRRR